MRWVSNRADIRKPLGNALGASVARVAWRGVVRWYCANVRELARTCADIREGRASLAVRLARPIARECYGLRERVNRFTIGEAISLVKCA